MDALTEGVAIIGALFGLGLAVGLLAAILRAS